MRNPVKVVGAHANRHPGIVLWCAAGVSALGATITLLGRPGLLSVLFCVVLFVVVGQAFAAHERAASVLYGDLPRYRLPWLMFAALAGSGFCALGLFARALAGRTQAHSPVHETVDGLGSSLHNLLGQLDTPEVLLLVLLFLSVLAPLVTLLVRYYGGFKEMALEHRGRKLAGDELARSRARWYRINNEFMVSVAVHFIPFVVLGLAMLFEYRHVREGSATGMAAIGAIMILYLLAELGAMLLSTVVTMRDRAEQLSDAMRSARYHLEGVEVIEAYSAVLEAYGNDVNPGDAMKRLVRIWKKIAQTGRPVREPAIEGSREDALLAPISGEELTGRLLRTVLASYFREESKDLSGELDQNRVPPSIWQGKKAIYMATNVGFFAETLTDAIECLRLSGDGGKKPCVASVTNVLPSWWWNWPREGPNAGRKRLRYKPVEDYRDALFRAVERSDASVFRLVLVRSDNDGGASVSEKEAAKEVLASEEIWRDEACWAIVLDHGEPSTRSQGHWLDIEAKTGVAPKVDFEYANDEYLTTHLSRGKKLYRILRTSSRSCHFRDKEQTEDTEGGGPRLALVESDGHTPVLGNLADRDGCLLMTYYERKLHRSAGGERQGATEVWRCDPKTFSSASGFNGRPDVTFLGMVEHRTGEAGADAPESDWPSMSFTPAVALLGTINLMSETMFLAIVHDAREVNDLWDEVCHARAGLCSDDRLWPEQPRRE